MAMKDSGIDWIGEIPNAWKISKLKYVSDFVNGDRGANYPSGDDLVDDGIIFVTSNNIHGTELDNSPSISKYITKERYDLLGGAKLEINDIIFCLRGSVGVCAINTTETEGTIASSLVDIKPRLIDTHFMNFFLQSEISKFQTDLYTNGSCAANLSADNVSNYYFIEPNIEEQQLIADFLDDKVGKIDDILADLNKQVEILTAYKKSLITETVTKGLNPNAPMKDSGIDWIGKIPEHWSIKRIKNVVKGLTDGTHGTFERVDNGKLLLSAKNVFENGVIIGENESEISENDHKSIVSNGFPKKGDVLLCCVGTVGRCTVYDFDESIAFQRSVIFMRCNSLIIPNMLKYCMQSESTLTQEKLLINKSAQEGLYQGSVKELAIPISSDLEEQNSIVKYLDRKCAEIDSLISDKTAQIEKMEKYKKSLIFEYVTGKKRVKEVV